MAGKYDEYEKILYGNKSSKKSALSQAQNTANTYKARLAAGGADPEQATDKRNFLEKALNLKQDQNVIFDLFELLNRPQQALFGGIESLQKGGDFLEGAGKGITGDKETAFKDILMNTGTFSDREGKLDLVDALGFAGDVFLDPADLVPVAGFDKANDILKAGGSLRDAYKATDSLTDVAFKGVGKAIKGTAKGADNLIEKGLAKLDETKGVLNNAGDVVKLKYLEPGAKSGANLLPQAVDELQDLTGATGRLQLYKDLKNKISNAFNVSDAAKEAIRTKRSLDASADTSRELSKFKIKEITDKAKDFTEKTGGKYGDATQLLNDSRMMINSTVNRTMDEDTLINLAKRGDMPAYQEAIDHLNNMLKRDVSDDVIQQIQQRYGKKAFEIKIDKGNKIKLGKGWEQVQFSNANDLISELSTKQKRFKELEDLVNNEKALEKLNPNDAIMLEEEYDDLVQQIEDLKNRSSDYTVRFNRRYTPEQERHISELAQRYGNNTDGFRDFVDDVFGTAWKRQDSDVVTKIKNPVASDFADIPLSKNQALLMDEEPLFTGRRTARDTLNTGNVRKNSEIWFRDEPITPVGYTQKLNENLQTSNMFLDKNSASNKILTANDLGKDTGGVYAGLLSKSSPEKTLNINANGLASTQIPYQNKDFVETLKTVPNNTRKKIEKIWASSDDYSDFYSKIKNDKELVSELKKLKINVTSKDLKTEANYLLNRRLTDMLSNDTTFDEIARYDFGGNIDDAKKYLFGEIDKADSIKNQDISYLIDILEQNDGKLTNKNITNYFKNNPSLTDDIVTSVANNQKLKRTSDYYNTIRINDVFDPGVLDKTATGDNIAIFNSPGATPRQFKALSNKTPALNTNSVFDVAENTKPITKGGADVFNDILDDTLNTGLGKKYNYLTNDNYVAANILTPEGKQVVDELNKLKTKGKVLGKGNSNLLNTRKYVGAPEETNNFIREFVDKLDEKDLKDFPALRAFKNNKNAQFMETDYIKALTNNYVSEKGLSNVASATQTVNQTILDNSFKNYDEMLNVQKQIENAYKTDGKISKELSSKYKELFDNSPIKPLTKFDKGIPDNFTKMSAQDFETFVNKYIKTNNQLGNTANSKELVDLLKKVSKNGNDIAINSDVLRVIGAASDSKNINALNTIYNKYLNHFKTWKTASPTNFLNNMFGNSSNMILGGVSMTDQARLAPQVIDIMTNGEKFHLQRLAGANLDAAAAKTADLWEDFRKMGFGNASLDLAELPEDIRDIIQKKKSLKGAKDYITKGLPSMFGYLNQKGDVAARLTVMLKAYESPGFLKKLGAKDAYEAISKIMFDPEMLTSTEKSIKQLIPFYTYTKNNLVYQITNIQNNGKKYNQLMKTMKGLRNAATNGNEDDMADYIKNNLYIPLPGLDKDGNYTVIRAQLPFGDLLETINDPLGKIANISSPLVKGIYEQATGIDTFTGRPIENFPGEKSKNINLLGFQPSKRIEKAISDFSGMDVFLKNLTRLTSKDPLNMVRMRNNINTDKLNKTYQQIDDLKNLMKQYEQKGYQFSTISELKKANKNNNIESINALFAKYGINTNNSNKNKSPYEELEELLNNR